jgi:hypothetical protein
VQDFAGYFGHVFDNPISFCGIGPSSRQGAGKAAEMNEK